MDHNFCRTGNWVLFTFRPSSQDSWTGAQIVAQSLASGERIVLVERDATRVHPHRTSCARG